MSPHPTLVGLHCCTQLIVLLAVCVPALIGSVTKTVSAEMAAQTCHKPHEILLVSIYISSLIPQTERVLAGYKVAPHFSETN